MTNQNSPHNISDSKLHYSEITKANSFVGYLSNCKDPVKKQYLIENYNRILNNNIIVI